LTVTGRSAHGFTLLELIIAVSLSAMVMGLLAIGVNIVLRDWERSENRLESELDAALGLLQLENALTGAYPHRYLQPKENKSYLYFDGKEKSLAWISTVAPNRQQGLTAWQLTRGQDDFGVNVRFTPAFAGNPEPNLKQAKPIELFAGYKLSFEYLEIDNSVLQNGEGKHRWVKTWDAKKRQGLPRAVRLILQPASKRKDQGLELDAVIFAYEHEQLTPVLIK